MTAQNPFPRTTPLEINHDTTIEGSIELQAWQNPRGKAVGGACRLGMIEATQPTPELMPAMIATAQPSGQAPEDVPATLQAHLYISHFLSTWNSRLFEFAAVLFLASIFPDTLLPMSVYALVRSGAAILFAQPIGSMIDKGNRLTVVRISIVGQRLAVAASCGLFWVLELQGDNIKGQLKTGLFGLTVILACAEKLCSVLNLVSVERDWVVVITEGNEPARRVLNARIRRIDLCCKLLGPLVISTIAIASNIIAIWSALAMNLIWFFANFHGLGANSVASATGLAVAVALSRIGLWCYDLCAQNIVQDEVEPEHRGSFSTVEAGFQNLFELLSYASTIIFSRPDQGGGIYSMHRRAYGSKKKHEFIYFML
ncbi:hypothetical protein DL765_008932 [Monosporascus sp. GIB2]|nr:hypothetical protein DL765_008932 [Monosporascus sp. GIB2]